MRGREVQGPDLQNNHKLIVGEGESDWTFFREFCARNTIEGYAHTFVRVPKPNGITSGFGAIKDYLPILNNLSHFSNLTDIVLVCDSTDNPTKCMTALRRQIREANKTIKSKVFHETPVANVVSTDGVPRLHVMMTPVGAPGGLESLCFEVARDALNAGGNPGTDIEQWVNTFADSACVNWTVEKRDKLRLQALLSAAWKTKPDMHFSQVFDITGDHLIPLDSGAFEPIREFLTNVASL